MKGVSLENIGEEVNTLKHYKEISMNMSDFLTFVKDANSPEYNILKSKSYQPILDFMGYDKNIISSKILRLNDIVDLVDRNIALENLMFNNPNNSILYWVKAVYSKEEKMSLFFYDRSIELDSSNPNAYSNRGTVKTDLGDIKGALEDYNKAIELDSSNPNTYYNSGIIKAGLGDKKGALD